MLQRKLKDIQRSKQNKAKTEELESTESNKIEGVECICKLSGSTCIQTCATEDRQNVACLSNAKRSKPQTKVANDLNFLNEAMTEKRVPFDSSAATKSSSQELFSDRPKSPTIKMVPVLKHKNVLTQTDKIELFTGIRGILSFQVITNFDKVIETKGNCSQTYEVKLFDVEKLLRDKDLSPIAEYFLKNEDMDGIVILETMIKTLCKTLERKYNLLDRSTTNTKINAYRQIQKSRKQNKKLQATPSVATIESTVDICAGTRATIQNPSYRPKGEKKKNLFPQNIFNRHKKIGYTIDNDLEAFPGNNAKKFRNSEDVELFQANAKGDALAKSSSKRTIGTKEQSNKKQNGQIKTEKGAQKKVYSLKASQTKTLQKGQKQKTETKTKINDKKVARKNKSTDCKQENTTTETSSTEDIA